ncbi:MAG: hypothetical protein ACJ8GN_26575 [Longimicrobiaceae bacterium]
MNLLMQWNENVLVRQMSDDGTKPETKECRETTVRYLAGKGVTDGSGNWQLSLTSPDVVCEQIGLVGGVSFVATATFNPIIDKMETDSLERPAFVMTGETHSGGSVTLYVRSYDCRCERLGGVSFDYHVAIAYDFVTAGAQPAG